MDAHAEQPLQWGGAGLVTEAAVQGTDAHAGVLGDVGKGQFATGVVAQPRQQRLQGDPVGDRWFVHDELCLPAGAFQRHDRQSGGVGCHRGAVVAPNHVQAQVEPGGGARRGQELAVVDVEDVRVDLDPRKLGGEHIGGDPVRGGTEPVEETGGGQGEGATADRGDTGPVRGGGTQRVENGGGGGGARVADTGHDDRVGVVEDVQPPRHRDAERARGHSGRRRTDPNLVAGPAIGHAGAVEHLHRRGEVERDDTVESEHCHGVHG